MRGPIRDMLKTRSTPVLPGQKIDYTLSPWGWSLLLAVGLIGFAVMVIGFLLIRQQRNAINHQLTSIQNEVNVLADQLAVPTSTPIPTPTPRTCYSGAEWLKTITLQEQAAQWSMAATNAQTVLAAPDICPEDRQLLAEKAVSTGLEALFAEKFLPEEAAGQYRVVERYQTIKRIAQENNVPLPSARQVAERAYQVGQFLLVKQTFEEALAAGEVTTTDQAQVQFYYAALYNLGSWWTDATTGESHAEGLRLLVASNLIDRQYQLGSGKAWGKLLDLLGPDETTWPEPAATPLLENPHIESEGEKSHVPTQHQR